MHGNNIMDTGCQNTTSGLLRKRGEPIRGKCSRRMAVALPRQFGIDQDPRLQRGIGPRLGAPPRPLLGLFRQAA
jgi:hypothetical protein